MNIPLRIVLGLLIVAIIGGILWTVHGVLTDKQDHVASSTISSTQAPSSASSTPQQCRPENLTASFQPSAGGAAAGNRYYTLEITNAASAACTVKGYPDVSLTDGDGNMIGSLGTQDQQASSTLLTLASQDKAGVQVKVAQSDNYPDGTCKPGVTQVRLTFEGVSGYLSVPTSVTTWCPGFTVSAFTKA